MIKGGVRPMAVLALTCLTLAGCGGCGPALPPAQQPSKGTPAGGTNATQAGGVTRGFKHPEYDSEQRLRSMLTGVEARPAGDGIMRITGLKLETYDKDGKVEMTVEAPECLFNRKDRSARSEGTLKVRSANDMLVLTGRGFEWMPQAGELVITNDSRTEIDRDMIEKKDTQP